MAAKKGWNPNGFDPIKHNKIQRARKYLRVLQRAGLIGVSYYDRNGNVYYSVRGHDPR